MPNRSQFFTMIRQLKKHVQNKPGMHVQTLTQYIGWQTSRELPDEVAFSDTWSERFDELAGIARREVGVKVEQNDYKSEGNARPF